MSSEKTFPKIYAVLVNGDFSRAHEIISDAMEYKDWLRQNLYPSEKDTIEIFEYTSNTERELTLIEKSYIESIASDCNFLKHIRDAYLFRGMREHAEYCATVFFNNL